MRTAIKEIEGTVCPATTEAQQLLHGSVTARLTKSRRPVQEYSSSKRERLLHTFDVYYTARFILLETNSKGSRGSIRVDREIRIYATDIVGWGCWSTVAHTILSWKNSSSAYFPVDATSPSPVKRPRNFGMTSKSPEAQISLEIGIQIGRTIKKEINLQKQTRRKGERNNDASIKPNKSTILDHPELQNT